MSTISDFRVVRVLVENEPALVRSTDDKDIEAGGLVDEYREYVTYNLDNNGSNLVFTWPDDFGLIGQALTGGGMYLDASPFEFGDEDFTIRMQAGLADQYPDTNLRDAYTVPMIMVGPANDPVFIFGMTNAGRPNYVKKGPLNFRLIDTDDNTAYCFSQTSDFYLGSFGTTWQIEISRTGQVFTLKLLSLYGLKEVSNTFNDFGTMKSVSGLTLYFMTLDTMAITYQKRVAIQVTKGVSRGIGSGICGKYETHHRFPNLARKKAEPIDLSSPLSVLIHGYLA